MTKEEAKEFYPILQAYAEGKEIECITIGKPKKGLCPDKWLDTEFFIIKFK